MTPWRWGRPGDAYVTRGARAQVRRHAQTVSSVRRLCPCGGCQNAAYRDELAWALGHHAGRVFAAREAARDGPA